MNADNWQQKLRAGQPKARTFTLCQITHYGDMTASLIHESGILGVIGDLEEFKQKNPALHQRLMQLCGTAATMEIGEVTGLMPLGTANETYLKLAGLLEDCMAISPRFEDRQLDELGREAARIAIEFKGICGREITDRKNGIIATALQNGLSQAKSPADVVEAVPSR